MSGAWETTLVQVLRGEHAWTFVQQLSSRNAPPEEGMEYVMVEARVRRIGIDDGARWVSGGDFYAVASDGSTYDQPRVRNTDTPVTWLYAGLYPGGTHQGWVALQVPAGDDSVRARFMPRGPGGSTDSANTRYLGLE